MKLNHKILGEGDPIVILHGLFGMLDNWQSVAKILAEDYMVILLDLRNHGKSPHSDEWNVSLMAEDVLQFMEDNWIYEATIIGHSMGGKVAMEVALKESDLVQRLIVVDIAPKKYPRGHDNIFKALNAVPIDEIDSRGEAQDSLGHHISELGVVQFLMKNISRKKEGGYQWKMNLSVIERNYDLMLQEVNSNDTYDNPTLFIKGSLSDYIEEDDLDLINALFPENQVISIEGAGHWVHADKRKELVEVVKNFLTN